MKAAERDEAVLRYIQESIARIGQYTVGGQETLLAEPIIQDATLRRLETLADAASAPRPRITPRRSWLMARLGVL